MQKTNIIWITSLVLVAIVSIAGTTYYIGASPRRKLVVSTTTSLYDTELLDAIEDQFEAKYSIDLYFISVGTGLAIKHAERGDADMILVHAPSKELAFLESGYGSCRKIVAYNFFALVGPEADPADIKDLVPTEALSKIVEAGRDGTAKWISRGDDSGTHTKEKGLWTAAGFNWTLSSEIPGYDGVNYGVFYDDIQLARVAIRHAQIARKLGVKKIVMGECGHQHKALMTVADRVLIGDLDIPRESVMTFLENIVFSGKIEFDPSKNDFPVTLHDPCNVVRNLGIVEPSAASSAISAPSSAR